MVIGIRTWLSGIVVLGGAFATAQESGRPIDAPPEPIQSPPSSSEAKEVFPRARLIEELIDYRLSPDDWENFCGRIVLSEEQRLRVEQLFRHYEIKLQQLREEQTPLLVPLMEMMFNEKQLAGKENRPPSEELYQSTWIRISRESHKGRIKVRKIHDALFAAIRKVLADEQYAQFDSAIWAWHREIMRNPRIGNEGFGRDMGSNVDVFSVMQKAMEDIPELAPYFDPHWIGGPDEVVFAPVRTHCQTLVQQFGRELDKQIVSTYRWTFNSIRQRKPKSEKRKSCPEHLRRWLTLHRLNNQIAESMAEIIQNQNPDLADRWRDAFYASCFPNLYTPREVDYLYEWIEERVEEIPQDQLNLIRGAYQEFTVRRRTMRAKTRTCLLNDMSSRGEPSQLYAFRCVLGDEKARECYGWPKMVELSEDAIGLFRGAIAEEQQAIFDAYRVKITPKCFVDNRSMR